MLKLAAILSVALAPLAVPAQVLPAPTYTHGFRFGSGATIHTSLSRQFEVREAEDTGGNSIPVNDEPGVHYVRVDPTMLTVSCERIKHAFLTEINAPDNWRDKIYIELRRAQTLNDRVIIESGQYGLDWSYHVSLPDTVENTRLVTSLVDVLLLEMANRKAGHSAEIPAWLGYGLSQDILRSSHIELVLEAPKTDAHGLKISTVSISSTNTNSLAIARADLLAAPPLTLEQLSWPDPARLDTPEGETYRSSAQFFVHELLRLKGGQAAMRSFIQELPQHLNWQLSFLDAFRADFESQLALEKWWELRLVDFTGRDISQTLSAEESWDRLEEIIRPVIEVRTRPNELPSRSTTTLQAIIEKWDVTKQFGFLRDRSQRLYLLRSRVSQELAKLVDDYRGTIDLYLDKRTRDGYLQTARAQAVIGLDHVARQTIADLNILDSIGEDLRPKPVILQSADAGQGINH